MALVFPHEIKKVTNEEDAIIKKYYKGYSRSFVRVGPSGYLSTPGYADHAADIYNLDVRPDDIWVVTFSRSGTTWLQEMVWLLENDLNFELASSIPLSTRFAYIEYPTQASDVAKESNTSGQRATKEDFRTLPDLPSPRYVKTHLPLSLLPPKLLDTSKVFYVARDPRDVAVSFHFMHKMFRYFGDEVEFKEFWELFQKDLLFHMPIFPHIEESWQKRNHHNMMFIFYEEMQKDLRSVIDRVCRFLNKDYSTEQKEKLVQHLSFENMKKSYKSGNDSNEKSEMKFMRKGKSGNWVNYFTEEMNKEANEYIERHLSKTDMRFPDIHFRQEDQSEGENKC